MIRSIRLVLAILLLAGLASAAVAQYEDDGPSKFGVRIVNFFPAGSELKDLKSTWLGPQIDYHLKFDEDGRPSDLVSIGLLNSGNGYVKASENFLTYTKINRKQLSNTKAQYMGFGGGFSQLKARSYGGHDSSIKPSIHVIYGQEFNDTYFAELRYNFTPKWQDTNWSGIYISIGSRIM